MKKLLILFCLIFVALCSTATVSAETGGTPLQIKSEAAVLLDSQTGAILYSKNAQERMYPASLTKIATAIYAIETGNLDDSIVVSENAVNTEGTKVYLEPGETVTLHHLLQGMLVNSGNDAAVAIAEYLNGDVESFSKEINKYLEEKVGVTNTHLTNPSGLFAADHFTTAEDLAKITAYAQKNATFKEIFGTKELAWDGQTWDTTLITHHQMLKGEVPYPGVTGGKTGFVNESKQTLATTAESGDLKLVAILLKADFKRDIYRDTKDLFDYGFQNFKLTQLQNTNTYQVKDKVFKLSKPTLIIEPLTGASFEVSEQGVLKVQSSEKWTFQEIQLDQVEKQMIDEPVADDSPKKVPISSMSAFFGIVVVLAAGATISVMKKQKM